VQELLLGLGRWLEVNGEAIYGTRHWQRFGEGPTRVLTTRFRERDYQPFTAQDVRFTTKERTLYAICLGWPEGSARITSLARGTVDIAGVSMLGVEGDLDWSQDEEGLTIHPPPQKPCDHAYTYKIALQD
jgi:alpha-L-fucosidase